MKDIFIGLVIIAEAYLVIDFIYTEKNTCVVQECSGCAIEEAKCGFIKNQFDININLFGRYW